MTMLPVVTAAEMKRLETLAIEEGMSEESFMLAAGRGVTKHIENFAELSYDSRPPISLLIGKGNNGGDAFVVGNELLHNGYEVTAYLLHPISEGTPLLQKMAARFQKMGGVCTVIDSPPPFEEGIIVDGLVGTGFRGEAKGSLLAVIEGANRSQLPIAAIDIPSGLDASTGQVGSSAICATFTVFLGLPKLGYFIGEGWNHLGNLFGVDFGLPERIVQEAKEEGLLVHEEHVATLLPPLVPTRHKYSAGYVLGVGGSKGMGGAAFLSCYAALKAGAGMVRLFHPKEMEAELAGAPMELVKEGWDLKDCSRIEEESKRAKALLIGPGMGRTGTTCAAVRQVLASISLPTVIDADALWCLAADPAMQLPEYSILTPHHGEMARILGEEPTMERCTYFVKERGVTLVLKGAPSMIFHPHSPPLIVPFGDPGMATAGSGDVLTGIIAAFCAQGLTLLDAAVLGVSLHAIAGEIAADSTTSYSLVASDLITYLSAAFNELYPNHFKNRCGQCESCRNQQS